MERRRWRPLVALAAIVALSSLQAAPDWFQRPRWAPPAEDTGWPFRLGVDSGAWFSDWNLRVETNLKTEKVGSDAVTWIAPRLDIDLPASWGFAVRYEVGLFDDKEPRILAAHLEHPILERDDGLVRMHFGPAVGAFNVSRFPGSFDDGVGFDVGVDAETEFAADWTLRVAATARYLTFDYDPEPNVRSSSDDKVGGFGFLVWAGLTYRF